MGKRTLKTFQRNAALKLRADATPAEAVLWRHLRKLDVAGSHFRRQVVIGSYITDFACMNRRLIVEVDGSQHGDRAGVARDLKRTQWLEAEGYRVLRFWNNDVMHRTDSAMEAIHSALAHPTPRADRARPSPSRGG